MNKVLSLLICFFIISCSENDDTNDEVEIIDENITVNIQGVVQKGPFASGTQITILDLDETLLQSGSTFYTTTLGNKGDFILPEVSLQSEYIELIADGSFFNEVTALTPDSRIILKAVSTVQSFSSVNINLLTTISGERIKYLVGSEGLTFSNARLQAQNEILDIFGFSNVNNQNFEDFDFSENGSSSNQLLAISGIILGIKNNQELTEFLTEVAFDIKEDGTLDSEELNKDLATSAETFPTGQIRINLRDFYNNGSTFTGFQSFVEDYKNFTPYESNFILNHPISNSFGINLLSKLDLETIDPTLEYCISENIVADNINIQDIAAGYSVKIAQISGSGSYTITPTSEFDNWNMDSDIQIVVSENSEYQGVGIYCHNPYNNPEQSKTPVTINFEGEGEIILRFHIGYGVWPFSDKRYTIDKYLKW